MRDGEMSFEVVVLRKLLQPHFSPRKAIYRCKVPRYLLLSSVMMNQLILHYPRTESWTFGDSKKGLDNAMLF